MYNSIIHNLYIVLCVHHPKSSFLPSLFTPCYSFLHPLTPLFPLVIPILLSVPMRGFFPLISSTCSPSSPTPLLSIYKSVSILFACLFCSLDFTRSESIWYLSFSDWLISLSIILSRSIHVVTKVGFPSFLWLSSIPLYKYTISYCK